MFKIPKIYIIDNSWYHKNVIPAQLLYKPPSLPTRIMQTCPNYVPTIVMQRSPTSVVQDRDFQKLPIQSKWCSNGMDRNSQPHQGFRPYARVVEPLRTSHPPNPPLLVAIDRYRKGLRDTEAQHLLFGEFTRAMPEGWWDFGN